MLLAKARTRDGGHGDRQGDGGADQPLRDVERCGPHHRMEMPRTVDRSSRSKNSPVVRTNILSEKVLKENADSIAQVCA